MFPKEAKGLVKAILDGYGQYFDKEKAQLWINQQRSHYAADITHELGSAGKIVNDFENPNRVSEGHVRYSVNPALNESKFAYQRRFDGFVLVAYLSSKTGLIYERMRFAQTS